MPKTGQTQKDRIARNMVRMDRETGEIAATSPDSESKEAMKKRMFARQRVTAGDSPGLKHGRKSD